jgi:hypothetical protein
VWLLHLTGHRISGREPGAWLSDRLGAANGSRQSGHRLALCAGRAAVERKRIACRYLRSTRAARPEVADKRTGRRPLSNRLFNPERMVASLPGQCYGHPHGQPYGSNDEGLCDCGLGAAPSAYPLTCGSVLAVRPPLHCRPSPAGTEPLVSFLATSAPDLVSQTSLLLTWPGQSGLVVCVSVCQ